MTFICFIFHSVVPAPNVTIIVLSDQSPLLLRCNVTTVMGINSTVDIVWTKDDTEILRENDVIGSSINNATVMLYTSHYIPDDNATYSCQAIINTNPVVNSSDNTYVYLTGESVM